ncbi:MAG TPA: bifunctional oligoribonuclease/PAP phosphatase NrnA, partial [Bacteroidetes bacterium]|nr:bifunctional oligoribonuclease/PAP phosphatase NrnA [Bacteroidota bacterium]
MLQQSEIQQVRQIIERYNRFVLTTHVNPDGDALGSEMAFARYLQQCGKQVSILNSSPTPETFHFLDPKKMMQQFDARQHIELLTSSDVLFILDISDWKRLRELGELVQTLPIEKVCIDHHLREGRFADVDIIHPQASSTGELLFELFSGLKAKMTVPICEALYTAILTDTGNFRFSNTSPRVMRIAAELMEQGIDR